MVDAHGVDLDFDTLTRAQDAVISVGGGGTGMLVSSSTNRLEGVVEGVTINLLSAKDQDVTVTVEQDLDGIVESIGEFVTRYNDVLTANLQGRFSLGLAFV